MDDALLFQSISEGLTKCSFWDATLDEGYGAWSQMGCQLTEENRESATCECSHLTSFTIVVDTSFREDSENGGRYTILGAVVILVCGKYSSNN